MKQQKGITLVALVITVIILLILAGITIAQITNSGLFEKAKEAEARQKNAQDLEDEILEQYEAEMGRYKNGSLEWPSEITESKKISELKPAGASRVDQNTILTDETEENKLAVIPKGFKLATDSGESLEEGIVIEDAVGNQFVWIPVGIELNYSTEYKNLNKGSTGTVELNRYFFGYDQVSWTTSYAKNAGTETREGVGDAQIKRDASQDYYFYEFSEGENKKAKDIAGFKASVAKNHGYYIGRYEAGKADNKIVSKNNVPVYNYLTRDQALELAQKMYTETYSTLGITATSDLMNSYAWDTAVIYLERCGSNNDYAHEDRGTKTSLLSTGQSEDVQCKINDMAKNVLEWTTEYCSNSGSPCVNRGGNYFYSNVYTSRRVDYTTSTSDAYLGFRPLLYL